MNRRQFVKKTLVIGGIGSLGGILLREISGAGGKYYFRPPGALEENDFLSQCIRCDKCMQACPYDSLKTGTLSDGLNLGTPYFNFREKPCYLCEDIPCITACPTNALNHDLKDIYKARMGIASITDRENCLSLNGLRCEICYRVCPLIDKAITIEKQEHKITKKHTVFEPVIHTKYCTGCGICEHSCPLDEPAITIIPKSRADKSRHYQMLNER